MKRVVADAVNANTARRRQRLDSGVERRVHGHHGEVVVVQSRAPQLRVLEGEAERLDEVQVGTGGRGDADRVAGVAGDARLDEHQVEHARERNQPRAVERPAPQRERGQPPASARSSAASTSGEASSE